MKIIPRTALSIPQQRLPIILALNTGAGGCVEAMQTHSAGGRGDGLL